MNADRREEKPTGGGRQRMKPAWKEQTGGLREEGKSKMAQIFRNEVRNITFITSCRPNGSKRRMVQKEASVYYWSFFLCLPRKQSGATQATFTTRTFFLPTEKNTAPLQSNF